MAAKPNYKLKYTSLLKDLCKKYPHQTLSTHIALSLADYGDIEAIDGLSDKELFFSLEKYSLQIELDNEYGPSMQKIIKDAMNLDTILDDEDDDDCL